MATELESMIDRHRSEVEAKIEELRPQYEEYERLVTYRDGMTGATPRARRATRTRSTGGGGGGSNVNRSHETLEALRDEPGLTIPDLAKKMDVSANYLYRVRDNLEKDGLIRREGARLFLTDKGSEEVGGKPAEEGAKAPGAGRKATPAAA